MKKLILTACMLFFIACSSDNTSNPASPTHEEVPVTPSSSSQYVPVTPSSSSQYVPVTPSSSSQYVHVTPSSSSKTYSRTKYAAEIGYICNGFNFGKVTQAKATEGYLAMFSICGDRATMTTGTTCRTASEITEWMRSLDITNFEQVNTDIALYGASFRWYNAVDGYQRYIYIEKCFDGKGLMKKQ